MRRRRSPRTSLPSGLGSSESISQVKESALEPTNVPARPATLPPLAPEVIAGCTRALRGIRAAKDPVRVIGVTSTRPGEGRKTIAAGLAVADARAAGRRCVLIDLDLDTWAEPASPPHSAEAIGSAWHSVAWINPDLGVLRLGDVVDGVGVTRADVGTLIAECLDHDTDVVASLACLPPASDGDRFADLFDRVVLVVHAGSTRTADVRTATRALHEPPVVVLNRTTSSTPGWLRWLIGQ